MVVVHVLVEWGGGGGGWVEGDKVRAHASLCTQPHTVDPQFNEVPRDWHYQGLVILKTSISQIFDKTSKMFIILACS